MLKLLALATVQKVLQRLLEEGVHIRDMRTIIEVLAEHGAKVQDAGELTALVRVALGRAIMQQLYPASDELQVMALEPGLERVLLQAVQAKSGDAAGIEPGLVDTLLREAGAAAQRQERLVGPRLPDEEGGEDDETGGDDDDREQEREGTRARTATRWTLAHGVAGLRPAWRRHERRR